MGVNSILGIGSGGLYASQAALQTTGNNIANVNTPGYSRQAVRFESWPSLDFSPGQMGQGVNALDVIRHFDKFVERQFLNKESEFARWQTMYDNMRSLENVYNESTGLGINSLLSGFFTSWEKLSQFPDDLAGRNTLLNNSQSLTSAINSAYTATKAAQDRAERAAAEQVEQANQLIERIGEINKQIGMHHVEGKNNANSLMDERDRLVRSLGELIDIDVIDNGGADYTVNIKSGYALVQGAETYALEFKGAFAYQTKHMGTTFDGSVGFSGSDGYEYTLEFVNNGTLGANDAQFKVSLDGGRTWVKDENGNEMLFTARESDEPVKVKDLEIYFNKGTNDNFVAGDRFTIVPKSGLYWHQATVGPINISPQQYPDGTDNLNRATGGSIAGNMLFRDHQAGQVIDQLDEFAKNLIWEVNRIHSQGAGLTKLTHVLGDYRVKDSGIPLGQAHSGLSFGDRLQEGQFTIALFDPATGKPIMVEPGMQPGLTFNFDPATDSLDDVISAMQNMTFDWTDSAGVTHTGATVSQFLDISVVDDRLSISSKNGFGFGFADDTSGLLAALGINTYFKGDGAADISVREDLVKDNNLVNAGRINGGAEINPGDSAVSREIAALAEKKVGYRDWTGKISQQTLGNQYGYLVSSVGSYTAASKFSASSTLAVAQELDDRQSEVAGVNLDEEMSNLIKFQSSYKAAAKLITTADQMLQTLLSLKQ